MLYTEKGDNTRHYTFALVFLLCVSVYFHAMQLRCVPKDCLYFHSLRTIVLKENYMLPCMLCHTYTLSWYACGINQKSGKWIEFDLDWWRVAAGGSSFIISEECICKYSNEQVSLKMNMREIFWLDVCWCPYYMGRVGMKDEKLDESVE